MDGAMVGAGSLWPPQDTSGQLILLYCMFWARNGALGRHKPVGAAKPLLIKRAIVEGLAQVLVVKQNPNKGVLD